MQRKSSCNTPVVENTHLAPEPQALITVTIMVQYHFLERAIEKKWKGFT